MGVFFTLHSEDDYMYYKCKPQRLSSLMTVIVTSNADIIHV